MPASILRRVIRLICKLRSSQSGSIGMIAGILILPILLACSAAIEYSLMLRARDRLQTIGDAAILAAGSLPLTATDQERRDTANRFFQEQTAEKGLSGAASSVFVDNEGLTLDAEYNYKLSIPLLGSDTQIRTSSAARYGTRKGRVLDVVMCIDATTSMAGTINAVRDNARTFPKALADALAERDIPAYDNMRVRAIYFRDVVYWQDTFDSSGTVWAESEFFDLPDQVGDFSDYVNRHTQGGAANMDFPESSHECLYKAMRSDWLKIGTRLPANSERRAVTVTEITPLIVLWTDDIPKPLNDAGSRNSPQNPAGMPNSDQQFLNYWNDPEIIDQTYRTFILFGPCNRVQWRFGMGLAGSVCGGSVTEGSRNMIDKIADGLKVQAQPPTLYLTR